MNFLFVFFCQDIMDPVRDIHMPRRRWLNLMQWQMDSRNRRKEVFVAEVANFHAKL